MQAGEHAGEFSLNRKLNAPPELVFEAWSKASHFVKWFPTMGYTMPFCELDFRKGGQLFYCLQSPDGKKEWLKGVYDEIDAPRKIVLTEFFSDKNGNRISPADYGFADGWPESWTTSVTIEPTEDATSITIRMSVPSTLAKEHHAHEGWSGTLQNLELYAASEIQ